MHGNFIAIVANQFSMLLSWSRKFIFYTVKEEDKVTGSQTLFQHRSVLASYCWTRPYFVVVSLDSTRHYIITIRYNLTKLLTIEQYYHTVITIISFGNKSSDFAHLE